MNQYCVMLKCDWYWGNKYDHQQTKLGKGGKKWINFPQDLVLLAMLTLLSSLIPSIWIFFLFFDKTFISFQQSTLLCEGHVFLMNKVHCRDTVEHFIKSLQRGVLALLSTMPECHQTQGHYIPCKVMEENGRCFSLKRRHIFIVNKMNVQTLS